MSKKFPNDLAWTAVGTTFNNVEKDQRLGSLRLKVLGDFYDNFLDSDLNTFPTWTVNGNVSAGVGDINFDSDADYIETASTTDSGHWATIFQQRHANNEMSIKLLSATKLYYEIYITATQLTLYEGNGVDFTRAVGNLGQVAITQTIDPTYTAFEHPHLVKLDIATDGSITVYFDGVAIITTSGSFYQGSNADWTKFRITCDDSFTTNFGLDVYWTAAWTDDDATDNTHSLLYMNNYSSIYHFRFNGGTLDSSGNNRDLTYVGAGDETNLIKDNGIFSYSYQNDGSAYYMKYDGSDVNKFDLLNATPLYCMCRVKISSSNACANLLGRFSGANGWRLGIDAGELKLWRNNSYVLSTGFTIADDTEHTIELYSLGSTYLYIDIDGQNYGSVIDFDEGDGDFQIGYDETNYLNGEIDEFVYSQNPWVHVAENYYYNVYGLLHHELGSEKPGFSGSGNWESQIIDLGSGQTLTSVSWASIEDSAAGLPDIDSTAGGSKTVEVKSNNDPNLVAASYGEYIDGQTVPGAGRYCQIRVTINP